MCDIDDESNGCIDADYGVEINNENECEDEYGGGNDSECGSDAEINE